MSAAIAKLPEWKILSKLIHKKFPNYNLMLQYVFSTGGRWNFAIAKKSTLPVIQNNKIQAYAPMHLSYCGIDTAEAIKEDPQLGMYLMGLSDGGIKSNTFLNFMQHPQLKDNVKFFKFLFKYIATGHGYQVHTSKMKACAMFDGKIHICKDDPILWHNVYDHEDGTWLEEFKVVNDFCIAA